MIKSTDMTDVLPDQKIDGTNHQAFCSDAIRGFHDGRVFRTLVCKQFWVVFNKTWTTLLSTFDSFKNGLKNERKRRGL